MLLKRIVAITGPPTIVAVAVLVFDACFTHVIFADSAEPRAQQTATRPYDMGVPETIRDADSFVPTGTLESQLRVRDYTVNTYDHACVGDEEQCGCFEVLKGKQRVYAVEARGYGFDPGGTSEGREDGGIIPPVGTDVTGDGQPDAVLLEETGGHENYLYILQIGGEFRPIEVLRIWGTPAFKDLNGDGVLEVLTWDETFMGWKCCNAYSPCPDVILSYCSGQYRVARDLMKRPSPPDAELRRKAAAIATSQDWSEYRGSWSFHDMLVATTRMDPCWRWGYDGVPPDLWREMLNLIYSGNQDKAMWFFDQAWKPGFRGKARFLKYFISNLQTSPYWAEIEELNRKRP